MGPCHRGVGLPLFYPTFQQTCIIILLKFNIICTYRPLSFIVSIDDLMTGPTLHQYEPLPFTSQESDIYLFIAYVD